MEEAVAEVATEQAAEEAAVEVRVTHDCTLFQHSCTPLMAEFLNIVSLKKFKSRIL